MDTTKKPTIVLLAAENTTPSVLYGLYDVLYSVGAVFADMKELRFYSPPAAMISAITL